MSIQIMPEMPTTGQALGQAFTRSLAENLPKHVERGALSAGLKSLGERAGGMDPLQLIAEAEGLPGMTDQKLSTLIPFLQSARAEAAAEREISQPLAPKEKLIKKEEDAISELDETSPYFAQKLPPEIIRSKARKARKLTGRTFAEEEAIQKEKFSQKTQRQQKYLDSKATLQEGVRSRVQDISQGLGFSAIPNEYLEQVISEAENELKKDPANPLKVIEKFKNPIKSFMETRADLKNFSPSIMGKGTSQRRLYEIREKYKKDGVLSLLEKDLTNYLGLSAPYAFKTAYGESAPIKSALSSLKKSFAPSSKKSEEVFRRVADKITPNDSILGIGIELRKKGYSPEGFLSFVKDAVDLSPHQERELQQQTRNFSPTLSDIYYEAR